MKAKRKELETEKEVAAAMIRIYCRAQHRSYGEHSFCPECTILLEYVCERVLNCPYGTEKPTCEQCTVHCYTPEMREKIREVMRRWATHALEASYHGHSAYTESTKSDF
jgi:hypothetical protein